MIRIYVLNGALMPDRSAMHAHLKAQFDLPDYYGNNLDALWDCLSTLESGTVVFHNAELAAKSAALPLVGLLLDLCREDPSWQLELHSGFPDCHKACDGRGSACGSQQEAAQNAPGAPAADAQAVEAGAGSCAAGTETAPADGDETVACGAMEDVCPYEL